jgi:hypothetical protein
VGLQLHSISRFALRKGSNYDRPLRRVAEL